MRLLIVAGLLQFAAQPASPQSWPAKGLCLRATAVGGKAVNPQECLSDPKQLAVNPDVRRIVTALGLDMRAIRFRGCATSPFTAQALDGPDSGTYLVTYAAGAAPEDMLAVLAHELSHLKQLQHAADLQYTSSLQVELGADFLAGLLYGQLFEKRSPMEFENNLQLLARYWEDSYEAHGTPNQRAMAFRMGYYFKFDQSGSDYGQALINFNDALYGQVARSRP
jgi:hypothetical protein